MNTTFFRAMIEKLEHVYGRSAGARDRNAMNTWYNFLRPYPNAVVAAAVVMLIDEVRSFPSLADIKRFIRIQTEKGYDEAFKEACDKIHMLQSPQFYGGKYHEPEFSDPLIREVIEVIGVRTFFARQEKDEPTMRAQFRDLYRERQLRRRVNHTFQAAAQIGNAPNNPIALLMATFDEQGQFLNDAPQVEAWDVPGFRPVIMIGAREVDA